MHAMKTVVEPGNVRFEAPAVVADGIHELSDAEINAVSGGILPFIAFVVATDLALIGLTFAYVEFRTP